MAKLLQVIAMVCVVVVAVSDLSMNAVDAQACSISQLSQCMGAVTRGTFPTRQCCAQVGAIADFNCFCGIMLNQRSNIPQAYIVNAVRVPSLCGPQGQRLRNRQCGNVRIP